MLLLAVLGNLAWSFSAKANFNGQLTIEIDGLKNKEGQVCASIFASSEGFPSDRALQKQCRKITDTPLTITFENLKAGSYAVALFHDQNNDYTLSSNGLGIPREGFGFSSNPEIRTRAPKFSEAAFLVAGPDTNIQIQLKYFLLHRRESRHQARYCAWCRDERRVREGFHPPPLWETA